MRPGKEAEYPMNLFNTWLDYRESLGFTRAQVIREINEKLNKKYYNERIYKWKKQIATVPDEVINQFIIPELPQALRLFFSQQGFPLREVDFDELARVVIAPDMAKFFKWYFDDEGYSSKKVNFDLLAEATQPPVAPKNT